MLHVSVSASYLILSNKQLKESTKVLKGCVNDSIPKPDHKTDTEIELESIEGQLRTLTLALEILTGVCANLPDPEPAGEGKSELTRPYYSTNTSLT